MGLIAAIRAWGGALGKRGALDPPHFAFNPRLYLGLMGCVGLIP